ncbi:TM2 domain-containing protein [Streptomyces sp. NPDC091406]|uniref:TM2 domain-containing protein n=1 Tax=unclassified Streptomyces TaxID=2593676 RepID=UPI0038083035
MSQPQPNSPQFQGGQQFAGDGKEIAGGIQGATPVGYPPGPNAPYGYDPFGRVYSDKSKITAGLLSVFLGPLGIGRFYTGHTGMAVAQLLTLGGLGVWTFFDGVILLLSKDKTDAQGRVLRG